MDIQRRQVSSQWQYHSIQGQLTNALASVLTVASGGAQIIVDSIVFTNITGGADSYSGRFIKSGAVVSSARDFATTEALAANASLTYPFSTPNGGGLAVDPGDAIWLKAGSNSTVNYIINYRTEN